MIAGLFHFRAHTVPLCRLGDGTSVQLVLWSGRDASGGIDEVAGSFAFDVNRLQNRNMKCKLAVGVKYSKRSHNEQSLDSRIRKEKP
jgi:hypothetical protein